MNENVFGTHLSQVVLSPLPKQHQTAKGVRLTMGVIFDLLCLMGELVHIVILNAANIVANAHMGTSKNLLPPIRTVIKPARLNDNRFLEEPI